MKKPIDPNLGASQNEELLFGIKKEDNTFTIEEKAVEEPKNEHMEEHHHHSSGEHSHHHHSSGSHHSSSSHRRHHHHHHDSHHHHHHSSGSGGSHHSSGEGSHSHHSSKKKKSKMPKALKALIIILLIIALLCGCVFGAFKYIQIKGQKDLMSSITTDVQETIEYDGHTYQFNENVFSVAFFGIDQREFLDGSETDFVGAADADMVITVDTQTGAVKIIALPRDTMVDVDQYSDNGVFLKTDTVPLCLSYAYGDGKQKSIENVMKAMSRILHDVPIQKYFTLELEGVAAINDAMGGVTVTSLYDLPDDGIKKGETVTLRGDAAEHYVRTRDMDDLDAALKRGDRQVQYVKAFINQLIPAVRNDFGTVPRLYNTASKYSRTNITLNNATYMASFLLQKGNLDYEVYTLEGTLKERQSTVYADVVHASFYPNEDSLMKTILAVYYTQID